MEASSAQRYKEKESRVHRPCVFDKMEGLVREMQDSENGVPVRSQKLFLTSIPSAFMGYDLIEWLMERLNIEESVEAVHIANQLCQYGYFFPVNDSRTLTVKDDSSLYRFQTPYYWPWQHRTPDNVEYAIYLAKRTLRNKQRHGLEEYEIEALNSLKRNLQNKWDIIQLQAEEQIRLSKERKKGDKIVCDSQERAFWRVYRPPPGCMSSLEVVPVPARARLGLPRAPPRKRTLNDLQREVDLLRNNITRTRIKASVAIENLQTHFDTYIEYDPMMTQPQPSNPWITDDQTFWQLNSSLVEIPIDKRVKRWGISMEELMSDPTGLQEFTNYLRKEYSHENIRFWLAVKDLRQSYQLKINDKVIEIFREFLAPGAPCEINIDGKTMEKVHQEMNYPTRFTFDAAAEHVYTLLLKKDCYPRFIRSDHYRNLLAAGVQPLQKKRFFGFVGQGKKKISSSIITIPGGLSQQQQQLQYQRRRGSDRSLSGSAHELAMCGVRDSAVRHQVPHSHSQSNLTDIPYRGDLDFKILSRPSPINIQDVGTLEAAIRHMDDVCPWDAAPADALIVQTSSDETAFSDSLGHFTSATQGDQQNKMQSSFTNSSQLDLRSSSSDVSIAIAEVSETLRKTSGISEYRSHQHMHDNHHHLQRQEISGSSSAPIQRNYSVSATHTSVKSAKIKLTEATRTTVSTYNFPSPQHSFDLSYIALVPAEIFCDRQQLQHESSSVNELPHMHSFTIVPDEIEQDQTRTITKAPLISISAIVGDLLEDLESSTGANKETRIETPDTSNDCVFMSEPATQFQSLPEVEENKTREQMIMSISEEKFETYHFTRESNARQNKGELKDDDATTATEPLTFQEQPDNNVNEVCPWEDEENCKVDTPYIKTYATLGYL
ncbi:PREDICTED: uncharacterized protein LOC105366873 [Ceratosolen solmsi marchali]|uniref:Uncharacterized protein LOC105366873 n=1 Tax=Ceratosolen solmsi marchali TaxID=326594 RepID=A0AAJ6YT95_9HYME|nr:PREDICTED: uncharacterized protein LOC105366873 [Ceratosolen solmsi marchali]